MKTILTNGFITATILHKGAELCSLKKMDIEYIWNGNPEIWGKHSPILFPIVGTLKNDTYSYKNNEYRLPRHGFARDFDFELVNFNTNSATFRLESDEDTLKNYPFNFQFFVNYALIENELKTTLIVKNLNNFAMPFSVGAHPAFALPNGFENYSLAFDKQENLECFRLDEGLISDESYHVKLNNKVLPLTFQQFENDALVMKKLESRKITINDYNKSVLSVSFSDFPNLGLWTKPDADFICIEPWCGYADVLGFSDAILDKEGILILNQLDLVEKSYSIIIN